jgi:hypothetical protein
MQPTSFITSAKTVQSGAPTCMLAAITAAAALGEARVGDPVCSFIVEAGLKQVSC